MSTYVITPNSCTSFGHREYIYDFPPVVLCDDENNPDGLISLCEEECEASCDVILPVPVPLSGELMYQLNFRDGEWDSNIITRLVDGAGNNYDPLYGEAQAVYLTSGEVDDSFYQTIKFNIQDVPLDCFGFTFEYAGFVYCTPIYKKEDCSKFVTIEGLHNRFDDQGHYYGDDDILVYSNMIYLKGSYKFYEPVYEDGAYVDLYRLNVAGFIDDKTMKHLTKAILSAKKVKVNGKVYTNTQSGSFNPVKFSKMFSPVLEFSKTSSSYGSGRC